jgi:hypothetical protein
LEPAAVGSILASSSVDMGRPSSSQGPISTTSARRAMSAWRLGMSTFGAGAARMQDRRCSFMAAFFSSSVAPLNPPLPPVAVAMPVAVPGFTAGGAAI